MSALTLNAAKDLKSSKMHTECSLLSDMPTNFGNLQHLLTNSMLTVNFTYSVTLLCYAWYAFFQALLQVTVWVLFYFFMSKILNVF